MHLQENKILTWSEVVYEGMLVYNRFVMLDCSGVSGESIYVAYNMRSVHEGVRFILNKKSAKFFASDQKS